MKLTDNWKPKILHADSAIGIVLLWFTTLGALLIYLITGRETNPMTWYLWALIMPPLILVAIPRDQGIARGERRRRWPRTLFKYGVILALMLGSVLLTSRAEAMGDPAPTPPAAIGAQIATEAQTFAIVLPLTKESEGTRLTAYLDPVGIPTICTGATRINGQPVAMGLRLTEAQCDELLMRDLRTHRDGLHKYFTDDTIQHRLPPTRDAAFTDFAFNVGVAAAGNSTATKRLIAGWVQGACDALMWWTRAGKLILRGLVIRVGKRYDLCMVGV